MKMIKKIAIVLLLIAIFPLYNISLCSDYNRKLFHGWVDLIKDGKHQNSRERVLISQAKEVEVINNRIISGVWVCPYSGIKYTDISKLDVDHIVPVKYAWEHGAKNWDYNKRLAFYNDLDNLLVVSSKMNRIKGDKGLIEWLPPNQDYVHEYIRKFNKICIKYGVEQ